MKYIFSVGEYPCTAFKKLKKHSFEWLRTSIVEATNAAHVCATSLYTKSNRCKSKRLKYRLKKDTSFTRVRHPSPVHSRALRRPPVQRTHIRTHIYVSIFLLLLHFYCSPGQRLVFHAFFRPIRQGFRALRNEHLISFTASSSPSWEVSIKCDDCPLCMCACCPLPATPSTRCAYVWFFMES